MSTSVLEDYWQRYRAASNDPTLPATPYEAEGFGDSPALADQLGHLILSGVKTATCSALWEWQAEQRDPPTVGYRSIVLDGRETPLCIIETTEVSIWAFEAVDERFAFEEGEDDRTLASWRRSHWDFFSRTLARIGRQPSPDMPLVCERFRVIHRW